MTVGIRELKANPSAILRRVRLKGEAIEITYRGEVVARIIPAGPPVGAGTAQAAWSDIDALSAEIGALAGVAPEADFRREI